MPRGQLQTLLFYASASIVLGMEPDISTLESGIQLEEQEISTFESGLDEEYVQRHSLIDVLFQFKGSSKVLTLSPHDACPYIQQELRNMGFEGAVVTLSSKVSVEPNHFFLQKWSRKWETFVDVETIQQIAQDDKLTVVPNPVGPVVPKSEGPGVSRLSFGCNTTYTYTIVVYRSKILLKRL